MALITIPIVSFENGKVTVDLTYDEKTREVISIDTNAKNAKIEIKLNHPDPEKSEKRIEDARTQKWEPAGVIWNEGKENGWDVAISWAAGGD